MKKQIILSVLVIAGIAFLSSCGSSTKPADEKKTDTVQTMTNKTMDNLMAAIKGETTASAKYAAYAQKARDEKFNAVAILFDAASAAEKIHAKSHTDVLIKMGGKAPEVTPEFTVKSTKENLDEAIKGETEEFTNMYPAYITEADNQEFDDAVKTFDAARLVEQKHAELYTAALKALTDNKLNTLPASYSVCPKCGMTYDTKKMPKECEVCSTAKDKFTVFK